MDAKWLWILLLAGLCGCDSVASSDAQKGQQVVVHKATAQLFADVPVIRPNPQRRCPLVAIVEVQALQPVTGVLEISDGQQQWTTEQTALPARELRLIAHSMRPDREHSIRVRITDPQTGGVDISEPILFTTPELPESFPPIETTVSRPEKMEPGVLMFPINLWREDTSMMDYGYLIALDERGEVRWFVNTGHRTADTRVLSNGHILFQHGNYRYAFEIDLAGQIIRQWHAARLTGAPHARSIPVDVDTMHHEIAEHPNGNFFTLSTYVTRFQDYPTSISDPGAPRQPAFVVCDELVEFEPDTGDVVRRIDLKQFLDTNRFGYLSLGTFWKPKYDKIIGATSRDWSHANALLLLPEENAAIVSFRHLDCLVKIDLAGEQILWIFGNPDGWGQQWQKYFLKPENDRFEWFYHQHGPQLTQQGIRLYDNGNYRARPFGKPLDAVDNRSRVVEFAINERAGTFRQLWDYDGSPDDRFYSPFYGEADQLPMTGNYLVTDGGHIELDSGLPWNEVPGQHQWARIFEITPDRTHEKVFEVKVENDLKSPYGWSIYRSMKLPSLSAVKVATDRLPDVEPDDEPPPDASETPTND